jgi:hypothetical protein
LEEQPTCGQGVAEHSVLPARLAEVTDAMAANLGAHTKALDPDDEAARQEHAVYLRLARGHRQAAAELRAIAEDMAAQRELPMGRHDEKVLGSPEIVEAFQRFIAAKQALLILLQELLEQDQRMLAKQPPINGMLSSEDAAQRRA